MIEDQIFLNYGIAGLILLVFYKLLSDHIRRLENAINDLKQVIEQDITTTKQLQEILNKIIDKL